MREIIDHQGRKFKSCEEMCEFWGVDLENYNCRVHSLKWTKEKTLRPYNSIDELFAETGFIVGEVVHIKRFVTRHYEEKTILNGFRVYTDDEFHRIDIIFGSGSRTLDELFKYYMYLKNGKWLPFGVEE